MRSYGGSYPVGYGLALTFQKKPWPKHVVDEHHETIDRGIQLIGEFS